MLEFISAPEAAKKWGIQKDRYKSYAKKTYLAWQSLAVCGGYPKTYK